MFMHFLKNQIQNEKNFAIRVTVTKTYFDPLIFYCYFNHEIFTLLLIRVDDSFE